MRSEQIPVEFIHRNPVVTARVQTDWAAKHIGDLEENIRAMMAKEEISERVRCKLEFALSFEIKSALGALETAKERLDDALNGEVATAWRNLE